MRIFRWSFLLSVICVSACTKAELPQASASSSSEELVTDYNEGVLRIKFDPETVKRIEDRGTVAFLDELAGQGVYRMERLFPDAGEMERRQRAAGLHLWYKLYYKKDIVSETKAAVSLSDLFEGAIVEKTKNIKPLSLPFNDPYNFLQWNLCNTGEIQGSVKGADINVLPVWQYTGGSSEVIVNVLDTGIDFDHPDLTDVVIPGGANGSKNFVDNNYLIKESFHGTHVSGIIAAVNNNGVGVSSIAGGLDGKGGVRILLGQIFKEQKSGTISADEGATAEAIVWGANHGALISQNSWGYSYDSEEEARQDVNPKSLTDAIDYFIKYAGCDENGNQTGLMKGGIVCFAAGNDGWSVGHPSDYDQVIAVGAVGPSGGRASYSNYGPWVDICAPGGDIDVFQCDESMILSIGDGGDYYFSEGTSMACPHVSGVAALMISLFGGDGFTNAELKRMLIDGANRSYGVSEQIGPMLNAEGAMLAYGSEETPPKILDNYGGDYSMIRGHEKLTVNYSVISRSKHLTISVDAGDAAVAEIGDRSFSITYNDGSGTKTGKYKAKIKVVSGSGLSTEKEIDYEILENHAPVVAKQCENQILRLSSDKYVVNCGKVFNDQDGGEIAYSFKKTGDGAVSAKIDGAFAYFYYAGNGVDTVTLTATDPCGLSCSQSFSIGCYDDSNDGPAAYPNPVTDFLSICVGGKSDTEVSLFSSTGVKLLDVSETCSVLEPIRLDLSGYAPGKYVLYVKYEGEEYRKAIMKK